MIKEIEKGVNLMFCPDINKECIGEGCRDWDSEKGQCRKLIDASAEKEYKKLYQKLLVAIEDSDRQTRSYMKEITESLKLNSVFSKILLNRIFEDPSIPEDVKQAIKKALEAPSPEVAEELLREEGLIQ